MSGGILRFPWTRQPQVPVGIDLGNSFASTLNAVLVPDSLRLRNVLNIESQPTTVGTMARVVGPSGVGLQYGNAGGTAYINFPISSKIANATQGYLFWKGQRNASGWAIFRDNQYTSTGTVVWDNGSNQFNVRINGTTQTGIGSFPANQDLDFLITGNSSACYFYVNGTLVSTFTVAWGFNSAANINLHQNTNNATGVLATDYLWAFGNRLLSAQEAKSLSGNPWQLFAPIQRTIWVPAAAGGATYTLTADSGSFALTGQDAGLAFNRTLAAASGSFALTGQDAGLAFNRVLSAANGSFALDGQDVTLTYTPISGATYTLGAASGSFALTGQDTGLAFNRVLTADTQSYSLSGDVAGLAFNRVLTADTVSYALTGQDASLSYTGFTYKLMADSASFALTGQDASFEFSGTTGVGGGGREKQRKKVLKDIKRLNELILKRDDEPDAEVTTVATPKPKAPKPAKFDTALITAKAKQQVIDDEEDELMLLMY